MCGPMLVERGNADERNGFKLPFGYNLDLLFLRRSDSSFLAAFRTIDVDFLEVELTAWEDAD